MRVDDPTKKTPAKKTRRKPTKKVASVQRSAPTVRYGQSITRNTGNYNSIKIQLEIELPCDGETDKDVLATLDRAREFVAEQMSLEVNAINDHIEKENN